MRELKERIFSKFFSVGWPWCTRGYLLLIAIHDKPEILHKFWFLRGKWVARERKRWFILKLWEGRRVISVRGGQCNFKWPYNTICRFTGVKTGWLVGVIWFLIRKKTGQAARMWSTLGNNYINNVKLDGCPLQIFGYKKAAHTSISFKQNSSSRKETVSFWC